MTDERKALERIQQAVRDAYRAVHAAPPDQQARLAMGILAGIGVVSAEVLEKVRPADD